MTESQKLHTAARRHCIERYDRNLHALSFTQSPQAEQNVRAGYLWLEAIRLEIERFDFDALPSAVELRELLVLAAEIATPFLRTHNDEAAQQEIKAEFTRFVESFDVTAVVEPLPYRRVLFGEQIEAVTKILKERWGATDTYFYPLDEAKSAHAATYFAYNDAAFDAAFPDKKLIELLRKHGVDRVYELREWGQENYLQNVELMNPSYTGAEVFISSQTWDWLFYASHEASITTAGWLTKAVQDAWPEWENARYNPTWWQPQKRRADNS